MGYRGYRVNSPLIDKKKSVFSISIRSKFINLKFLRGYHCCYNIVVVYTVNNPWVGERFCFYFRFNTFLYFFFGFFFVFFISFFLYFVFCFYIFSVTVISFFFVQRRFPNLNKTVCFQINERPTLLRRRKYFVRKNPEILRKCFK